MATVKAFPWIDHFYIVADVRTLWPAHIREIEAAGLDVTFEGSTRANLVDDAIIARLSFGLETIDPAMRETMEKKVTLSAYITATRICNAHGVEATNSCMIGLPGEMQSTAEMLFKFLENTRDALQANFAIAIPYAGTAFNDMVMSGMHGVELLSEDHSKYLRHGNAVTKVGDLTGHDLIELQNEGFVRFYSTLSCNVPQTRDHRPSADASVGATALAAAVDGTDTAVQDRSWGAMMSSLPVLVVAEVIDA